MTAITATTVSLTEFLQRPETKPASECIDGRVIQKPMPQGQHSTLQVELTEAINAAIKKPRLGRAYTELRCVFGDRAIVPDIAVFAWSRIPVDEQGNVANRFELAPDWLIEILSPEQNQTQVTGKILHALDCGSAMGWLIDPDAQSILAYPSQQQPQYLTLETAILPVPEFASTLRLTVGEVFGWLKLN